MPPANVKSAVSTSTPSSERADAIRLGARMADITPFYVMDLLARAKELEAQGRSIVKSVIGEPDFPTPQPIVEAGMRALDSGPLPYTVALGITELREAIARHYFERFAVRVDPARIVVTAGASGALLLAMAVLLDSADQVLMTDPGYPCNRQFVRVMGGEVLALPVDAESQYQLTADMIERAWGARSAAALIATPSNPTGTSVAQQELADIALLIARRGGTLIVDEIYQGLTYDHEPSTALSISDDLFIVNSFSKYFQMTGWRLGWLVVPSGYVREIEKLAQNLYISASTPAQYAALAAFAPETRAITEARRREFQARRDFLVPALRELGFVIPVTPQGAFYVYADCSRFTDDSFRFAWDVLENAGVAIVVGKDFGAYRAERHVRFSYCASIEQLEEMVRRLKAYLHPSARP